MPARSRPRPTVAFTVTTADTDAERFFTELAARRIDTLIDIRPDTGQGPDWANSSTLAERATQAGLKVLRTSALAPPVDLRHPASGSGDWVTFRDSYSTHLAANRDALRDVRETARERRVALVCDCSDAQRCHRGILAERLVREGIPTTHIFPGLGRTVTAV